MFTKNAFSIDEIVEYIYNGVNDKFAACNDVKKQQVTQWKRGEFVILDGDQLYSKRRDLHLPELSEEQFMTKVLSCLEDGIRAGAFSLDDLKNGYQYAEIRTKIVSLLVWHQAKNNAWKKVQTFSFSDICDSRFFTVTVNGVRIGHVDSWFKSKVAELTSHSTLYSKALKLPHVTYCNKPVELVLEDVHNRTHTIKPLNALSNIELVDFLTSGSRFFVDNSCNADWLLNDIEKAERNKSNRLIFPFFFKGAEKYKIVKSGDKYIGYYKHAYCKHISEAQWERFPCHYY